MYRCEECGLIFENPKEFFDDTGEMLNVCPECFGNYDEVHECYDCGDITLVTQKLCRECQKTVIDYMKEIFHRNLNEPELEYLNEYYDGKRLE